MTWPSSMFGRPGPEKGDPAILAAARAVWPASMFGGSTADTRPVPELLRSDGRYAVAVVGELQYQRALDDLCGGRTKDGHHMKAEAVLVLEDSNEYDPLAVRVDIHGKTVGYLTRAKARKYRQRLADLGVPPARLSCPALIRGGFERDGNGEVGYYGVWLDLHLGKRPRTGVNPAAT